MPIGKILKRQKLSVWEKRGKGLALAAEFRAAVCSMKWGTELRAVRNVGWTREC